LSGSGDGEAKTAAHLRLALVYVIIVRWFRYLYLFIIINIIFGIICNVVSNNSNRFTRSSPSWTPGAASSIRNSLHINSKLGRQPSCSVERETKLVSG
jgi:hypothetical protein